MLIDKGEKRGEQGSNNCFLLLGIDTTVCIIIPYTHLFGLH